MNQDLQNYINSSRAAGQTDQQIKQVLMQNGWSQVQINEAFGVPTPPPTAGAVPPPPVSSGVNLSGELLDLKTKETLMWSIIGYFIKAILVAIGGVVSVMVFWPSTVTMYGVPVSIGRPSFFNVNFVNIIISSIVFGGVFALLLAKVYSEIQRINQTYFKGWFNSLFKLIFYPSIIVGIISLLFAGAFSLTVSVVGSSRYGMYSLMYLIISIVTEVIGSYIYAKLMQNKVGKYYQ